MKKYDKIFPTADEFERRVVTLNEETPQDGYLWDTTYCFLWGRAFAYIELGDYDKAIAQAMRACNEVPAKHQDPFHRVYSLSALALAYALQGDRENALKVAAELEAVGPITDNKYRSLQTELWMELAKTYLALKDYDRALATMQQAKRDEPDAVWKFFGNILTGAAASGINMFAYQQLPKDFMLAKCLMEVGQIQKAKEGYDRILAQPGTSINGDIYWMALFDRGRIAEKEGQLKEAIALYEKAADVIEAQRSTINTEASKIGYIGDKQTIYHHLISALFRDERHAKAFEYVERSKSRALVDMLASKKEFAIHRGDKQEIQAMLDKLDALEKEGRVQETVEKAAGLSQRRSAGSEVKERLKTAAPDLASLLTVSAITLPQIQSHILLDEMLVEFFYQGNDLYAFVVGKDTLQAIRLEGGDIARDIREFRSTLQDPTSERTSEISVKLYDKLMRPLEPYLLQPNLVIVPHGILHYLPFNALSNGQQYLLDRYSLRYLPSASVIVYLGASPAGSPERLMAIGNPDLGARKPPLNYAEHEVRAIAKDFPQATVLVGKGASETVFKSAGAQFSHIHLATHGIFESEDPLHSGLLLAKDDQNDGILNVGELYSLRLGSELVTLSACETGMSAISNGDELVGLARGFLYAGSKSIVASLWSVDDEATAFLMSEFYADLRKTNKRESLRLAQLATKKKYPHPFYWAAFELTGQP